jgi:Protein of unknown function (DUF3489)
MRRTKTDTRNTDSHPSAPVGRARQRSVPRRDVRRAKIFRIDKGKLQVYSLMNQKKVRSRGREAFFSERQLARLTAGWPMSQLAGMWNGLPGVKPVDRFTDRKTAVRRIWKAVQRLKVDSSRTQAVPSGLERRSASRATSNSLAPESSPRSTKADQIIGLLKRPSGATLKSIMAVTGWQAHSVRGFISGQLRKRMGLEVHSFDRKGDRVYTIRS